jgi:hypothetical protein
MWGTFKTSPKSKGHVGNVPHEMAAPCEHVADQDASEPIEAVAEPTDDRVRPSHYWTWRLLSAGFSAEECEAIRGIRRDVVLAHVLRAADEGLPVRAEWCLSAELLAAIRRAVPAGGPVEIRPLLDRLPPGTRYEEVQLFLKCLGWGDNG